MNVPLRPDGVCLGYTFQIYTDIMREPRISLRILFKFIFAPVTAEIIPLVPVHTGKFCIFLINYHQTDWICCHGWLPLFWYQYRHIPLSDIVFFVFYPDCPIYGENRPSLSFWEILIIETKRPACQGHGNLT